MQPRPRMSNWLDPRYLIEVGVRAGVSALFGEFADRRDAEAAVRPLDPDEPKRIFSYSVGGASHHGEQALAGRQKPLPLADCDEQGNFWFDYMADTGDGWNQTYSMARLLARPQGLQVSPIGDDVENLNLPRARALILGGDQVYPMATPHEYETRLIEPFDQAVDDVLGEGAKYKKFADVFAIPGNHDWYDGLRAFLGLFCRFSLNLRNGRLIGGRRAPQTRSYFALQLPHNWWLWGVDSQLKGYVDQPQIDYFANVAKNMMDKDSNLIICTGYPSWTRVDPAEPGEHFSSFAYVERLLDNYGNAGKRGTGQVRLSISGDLHHYVRHKEAVFRTEDEVSRGTVPEFRHYVTCGGGGAYAHPTTDARDEKFVWKWPAPRMHDSARKVERHFKLSEANGRPDENALYPSPVQSKLLALWAFALPLLNPGFTAFMALIAGISYFAIFDNLSDTADVLLQVKMAAVEHGWRALFQPNVLHALGTVPWLYVHFAASVAAYFSLADFTKDTRLFSKAGPLPGKKMKSALRNLANCLVRGVVGVGHAAAQTAVMLATGLAVVGCWWPEDILQRVSALIVASAAAGFGAATLIGAYYFLMFQLFNRHCNHLFSAIRVSGYKSFLRMKIDQEGNLTLYPIGVKRTEGWFAWLPWSKHCSDEPGYHLIEDGVLIERHTPLRG